MMRNTAISDNSRLTRAIQILGSRLPDGWRITPRKSAGKRSFEPDAKLTIRGPDGASSDLLVEIKRRLSPREAAQAAVQLARVARDVPAPALLVISDYLSELSRNRLRASGLNYIDLTGNLWIALERPALFIETQGSDEDPSPTRRGIRSLKGAKAARVVRALCDRRPPVGVRELARQTRSDPGYVSRLLELLVSDDLIQRSEGGQITDTNWQDLIRRWSRDYSLARSNRSLLCLARRGLDVLVERLRSYRTPYALTGSLAVPAQASVAPGRMAACYVNDPERAAGVLDVRPAETGANVLLLEPFDTVVYEGARTEDGLVKVAVSQCAVDLLTGGGRGPAEADALLAWMAANEDAWRS